MSTIISILHLLAFIVGCLFVLFILIPYLTNIFVYIIIIYYNIKDIGEKLIDELRKKL